MSIQINNYNATNLNLIPAKHVILTNHNNKNVQKDVFIKSNISFCSSKGVDWYGTSTDREALKYKVQLTPKKIDSNIKTAETRNKGILKSYNELSEDAKKIGVKPPFFGPS